MKSLKQHSAETFNYFRNINGDNNNYNNGVNDNNIKCSIDNQCTIYTMYVTYIYFCVFEGFYEQQTSFN